VKNINLSWKIMNDPSEPHHYRADAEAEVREFAWVGMVPDACRSQRAVLAACATVRNALGVTVGPQPVRFEEAELHLLIGAMESIAVSNNQAEVHSILNKLRHREKTMRNAQNRDRRDQNDLHIRRGKRADRNNDLRPRTGVR
jgi:hypothetical protein